MVISASLVVVPACGKRGPPLPPLRPVPGPITELSLVRRGDDIAIRFRTPAANMDGSRPVVFDRVEVYALTTVAGATPPTALRLMQHDNLLAVLGKADPADAKAAADAAPGSDAGRIVTFVDKKIVVPPPPAAPVTPATPVAPVTPVAGATGAPVRYYLFQSFAKGRRVGSGQSLGVALIDPPPQPENGTIAYDEQTLTLTWPAEEGAAYFVYNASSADAPDVPLQAERLKAGKFTQPVVFGKRACFVVRAVTGTAPVSIESSPSAEVCETPVDTFPPPAPSGLIAVAAPGAISLTWDAVTAADLAGYIVLRGEGSSDRLQPLMTEALSGTSFNDQTAKAGVRYFYAVIAVDKAVPANRSKNSNVVEETGR